MVLNCSSVFVVHDPAAQVQTHALAEGQEAMAENDMTAVEWTAAGGRCGHGRSTTSDEAPLSASDKRRTQQRWAISADMPMAALPVSDPRYR